MAPKHAVEVGEVVEAAGKGDLADGVGSVSKLLAGVADSDLVEKSRIGFAGVCGEASAEVGFAHVGFGKDILERERFVELSQNKQDCTLNRFVAGRQTADVKTCCR